MKDEHYTRGELLDFIEGCAYDDVSRNEAALMAHLDDCEECFRQYEGLVELASMLKDPSLRPQTADAADDAELQKNAGRQAVRANEDDAEGEAAAADAFLVRLAKEPVRDWEAIVGASPHECTSALAQRLVDLTTPELDRNNPETALLILRVAELVAFALDERASVRARGYVWKQRSNALRRLAQYDKAIEAAILAQELFAELDEPDTPFEVAQARYAMAAAVAKMARFPAALQVLGSARELLREYGTSAPLAKVMMLEAVVLILQGDSATARDVLRALLPIEQELNQPLEVARVRMNIAECNLRLGALDDAMPDAIAAVEAFRALGNTAEEARGEWTVAMIRLARGKSEAIDRLYEIATVYTDLGMPGEAGFVKLDITAERIQREEWIEAETLSRELVALFTAAGVTLASVEALHYLRRAVENREATAATVHYVRDYVTTDNPARPFEPPAATAS